MEIHNGVKRSKRLKKIQIKNEKNKVNYINNLPLELLEIIFSYFHPLELNVLRQVCKEWSLLIKNNQIINRVFDKDYQPLKIKANNFKSIADICYCNETDILAVVNCKSIKFYKNLKLVSIYKDNLCKPLKIFCNNKYFFALNYDGLITKFDKKNLKYASRIVGDRCSKMIVSDKYIYKIIQEYLLNQISYIEKFDLNGKKLSFNKVDRYITSLVLGPDQDLVCAFFPSYVIKFCEKKDVSIYKHIFYSINRMKYQKQNQIFITSGTYTHIDIWDKDFILKNRINFKHNDFIYVYISDFYYCFSDESIIVINHTGHDKWIGVYKDDKLQKKKLIISEYTNPFFIDKYGRFVFLEHTNPNFLVY